MSDDGAVTIGERFDGGRGRREEGIVGDA